MSPANADRDGAVHVTEVDGSDKVAAHEIKAHLHSGECNQDTGALCECCQPMKMDTDGKTMVPDGQCTSVRRDSCFTKAPSCGCYVSKGKSEGMQYSSR